MLKEKYDNSIPVKELAQEYNILIYKVYRYLAQARSQQI
jgi:hypothetical protein